MLFERKDIKKIIEISERVADGNKSLSAQDVIAFDTFYNVTARKPMVFRPWDEWH